MKKLLVLLPIVFISLNVNAQSQYQNDQQYQSQYQQQQQDPQAQYQPQYQANPQPQYQNQYRSRSYSILYFKGALGTSSQGGNTFAGGDISYGSAAATSLSIGLNMSPQLRSEIEFSARSSDISTINGTSYYGNLDSSALMFNTYFNIPLRYGYNFFVGAGLGFLSAELYDAETDNYADGSSLASQFMLGFEADVTDHVGLLVEYKSITAFDLQLSGTSGAYNEDFSFNNGSFLVGLKYNF